MLFNSGERTADPHSGYLTTLPAFKVPYTIYAVCEGTGSMSVGNPAKVGLMTLPCNNGESGIYVNHAAEYDAPLRLSVTVGGQDRWQVIILPNSPAGSG